jgi:hypothetical protein
MGTRFFVCKFCGKRAGYSEVGAIIDDYGALHEDEACDMYARMTAQAFVAAHADAPSIPPPFGKLIIDIDNPDYRKEGES